MLVVPPRSAWRLAPVKAGRTFTKRSAEGGTLRSTLGYTSQHESTVTVPAPADETAGGEITSVAAVDVGRVNCDGHRLVDELDGDDQLVPAGREAQQVPFRAHEGA